MKGWALVVTSEPGRKLRLTTCRHYFHQHSELSLCKKYHEEYALRLDDTGHGDADNCLLCMQARNKLRPNPIAQPVHVPAAVETTALSFERRRRYKRVEASSPIPSARSRRTCRCAYTRRVEPRPGCPVHGREYIA